MRWGFLLENRPLVLELRVVDVSSLGVERGRVEVDEKLKTVGVRAKPERSNDGRVNSGDSITFWPFNPPCLVSSEMVVRARGAF